MALAEKLAEDMKAALKADEKLRLGALRMALAEIKQHEIDTRTALNDTDVIRVIEKLIRRGRDAETQFRAGSMRHMGKVMGLLKERSAGRVDMGAAHRRVQELLRQIQEN